MAKAGLITDVIDVEKTQKQIDETIAGLVKVIELVDKANAAAKTASRSVSTTPKSGGLSDYDKAQKEVLNQSAKAAKELAALEKKINDEKERGYKLMEKMAQKELAKKEKQELKEMADAEKALNKEREKAQKQIQKQAEELKKKAEVAARASQKEAEYIAKHGKATVELEREVKRLEVQTKEYILTLGKNNVKTIESQKEYDRARAKLTDLNQTMGNHRDDVGRYGKALEGLKSKWMMLIGAFGAAMAAGAGVIAYFKSAVEGAMADERAEIRLSRALNNNSAAMERMIRFKDRMMKSTLFSEDEIMAAITMGKELGRTELETRKIVETAMGLSRLTGTDLNTNMLNLSATYEGQTGKLGKLSEDVKGLTDEQLKNGEAVDILNQKYGKLATEGMETMSGRVEQAKKWWSEFTDDVGVKVINVLQGMEMGFKAITAVMAGGVKAGQAAYVTKTREQIKATMDNIEAMRAQAKLDQNRNFYLESLENIEKQTKKNTDTLKEETIKKKEAHEKEKQSINEVILEYQRLSRAIGGGQKLGAQKITAQVNVGGAPPTMEKVEQGPIPETKTDLSDENALTTEMDMWNQRVSIAADAMGKIDAIVNASYQNRVTAIDNEQSKDEEAREKELRAAGNNKAMIEKINQKYDLKEKEREKEKKKLLKEQATYQKTSATIQAIINTALGVTGQLAGTPGPAGFVLAALALAAGIAEIAVIQSQPIPSYAKGRKGGKAEIANINEVGQEAIVTKEGDAYLPQGNIAYLPEGSSVIPHSELVALGAKSTMTTLPTWQQNDTYELLRGEIKSLHLGLATVIRNKRENYLHITDGGIKRMTKEGNTWTEWVNNNVRL